MPQRIKSVDDELVRLKAEALDKGMLKLATWGKKEEIQRALGMGRKVEAQGISLC